MVHALREDGRPAGNPAELVAEDDVLDDVIVEQILEATPETLRASPALDAAVGIRNALIGGVLFWALAAAAYFALG
jgi:hypothetical protein